MVGVIDSRGYSLEAKCNCKIQLLSLLKNQSIWLLSIRHFRQVLLLIFHTRDEVQKFEYRPNYLSLGTPFKHLLKVSEVMVNDIKNDMSIRHFLLYTFSIDRNE